MSKAELDQVRQRFENDAKDFDAIYRLERSPFWRWFNTVFRKAVFERYQITFEQAGDVTGKSVLDIGCGSGVYSVDFARRGARRVLGVDFASNMLALAREEARKHNVESVCEFVEANFLDLDPDEKFDVSIAIGVFDYLRDPQTFLNKMASVTTGRVIGSFPGHSLFRKPLRKMRYQLTGRGNVYYYTEADLRRLAAGAGFRDTTIIPIHSSGTGFILVGHCGQG